MVLPLHGVFQVLGGVLDLAQDVGGVVEVVHDLGRCLLVGKGLQPDEGFGLGVCEAADEHTVSPPSHLPRQLKLLQLGDGRLDSLPADHLLHLGCRAPDKSLQYGAGSRRCWNILARPKAGLQDQVSKC